MKTTKLGLATTLLGTLVISGPALAGAPVFATNNAAARYEDGVFRLPPLNDPRDKYVLLITVDGKRQPAINLPAGATGLLFGANATPAGNWSWSVALQHVDLPSMPVITEDKLIVPAGVLTAYQGRLVLEWKKVPEASSYRVAIATWDEAKNGKAADWGDEKKVTTECSEPELTLCNLDFEAESGKRYRWTVTAVDASKIDIARSAPQIIETVGSNLSAIKKAGWSLQRSDAGSDDDKKSALFSYARAQDSETPRVSSYSAALALIWQPAAGFSQVLFPRASIETRRTSSGEEKENDATTLRAGLYGTSTNRVAGEPRTGYNWTTSLKYEEARKDGTRKGLVEFRITPFIGPLGRYVNIPSVSMEDRNSAGNIKPDHFPVMQIMPVVSFGLEIGKTFEIGSSEETQEKIRRLRTDLRFDVLWPRLSNALGVLSVSTYAAGSYWRLPGQGEEHHVAQAGISVGLTPEISFDVAYKVGEEAPNFKFSRSTNVGIGFKF